MPELTPPLRWAGGKRWLAPRLAALYAPHRSRRWVEPFVGGMGVALRLLPERALLNDINGPLVNFYEHLQLGLQLPAMAFTNEAYCQARADYNRQLKTAELGRWTEAHLFYYLNRTCFNGLYRVNAKGEFNVGCGKLKRPTYVTDFSHFVQTLKRWIFTCLDFSELALQSKDFVYADPPFDAGFAAYDAHGFPWRSQVRLAGWLAGLSGPVVASNRATDRVLKLYQSCGFRTEVIAAPRSISCDGDRTPVLEMLATKGL